MLERPEPDAAFLELDVSPKQLLGLMIGGETKANRVAAERIPLAAAYILKHYHHVDIKPSKLKMRDIVGIQARHWDKHLPQADIDLLVNILWDKGYTLGQKLSLREKEPLSARYSSSADDCRGLVVSRPMSPLDEFLGVASAVLGRSFQLELCFPEDKDSPSPSGDIEIVSPLDGDVVRLPHPPALE